MFPDSQELDRLPTCFFDFLDSLQLGAPRQANKILGPIGPWLSNNRRLICFLGDALSGDHAWATRAGLWLWLLQVGGGDSICRLLRIDVCLIICISVHMVLGCLVILGLWRRRVGLLSRVGVLWLVLVGRSEMGLLHRIWLVVWLVIYVMTRHILRWG